MLMIDLIDMHRVEDDCFFTNPPVVFSILSLPCAVPYSG